MNAKPIADFRVPSPMSGDGDYRLQLFCAPGERLGYRFFLPQEADRGCPDRALFAGDDFRPSPLHAIDGDAVALALLSFLTLQPGDTDAEYFNAYTDEQMGWAQSYDCEALGAEVYLWEENLDRLDRMVEEGGRFGLNDYPPIFRQWDDPEKYILVTYAVVTLDSAEEGDFAECGWEDTDGYGCDPDDIDTDFTAVDNAVDYLQGEGVAEASSYPYSAGCWYIGQVIEDRAYFEHGEEKRLSYHLEGFTEEEEREIYRRVTGRVD